MNNNLLEILYNIYRAGYKSGLSNEDPISEEVFKSLYQEVIKLIIKNENSNHGS
jgi:hypothetical protein